MKSADLVAFAKYNVVGLVTTLVGLPLMVVLDWAGVPYAVYTGLNYLVGIGLGFWLNFRFAFADRRSGLRRALPRYLVTFLVLLAGVQALQFGLIEGAGWPTWAAVVAGMAVYASVGYAASRWWVFVRAG